MTDYNVKFTNIDVPSILLEPKDINKDYGVTLFGRTRLQYGRDMNENILHLLEHFACREDADNPGNPDLALALDDDTTVNDFLGNPVEGQIWLNSTTDSPFFWDGSRWVPFGMADDYAANSGRIAHGEQIPLPVSVTGYGFSPQECVWIVSPSNLPAVVDYFICRTDSEAIVNMQYSLTTSGALIDGCANYLIFGLKHNTNNGELPPDITPTPTPSVTPNPVVTPSVTPGAEFIISEDEDYYFIVQEYTAYDSQNEYIVQE
jgi:hypothetical protein